MNWCTMITSRHCLVSFTCKASVLLKATGMSACKETDFPWRNDEVELSYSWVASAASSARLLSVRDGQTIWLLQLIQWISKATCLCFPVTRRSSLGSCAYHKFIFMYSNAPIQMLYNDFIYLNSFTYEFIDKFRIRQIQNVLMLIHIHQFVYINSYFSEFI